MNYNLIQEFVRGCVSIYHAVDFIGVLGTTSVSLLKISVLRMCHKKMGFILESAVNDWSMDHCEKSREIMRRHAVFGTFVSVFQFSSAAASAVLIVIVAPPTLEETPSDNVENGNLNITEYRNVPMGSGCSVVGMPIFLYLTFYVFQLCQLICLCFCSVGIDSIFFAIVMHLCAQFKLLNVDIARLGHHVDQRNNVRENFISNIERHKHLSRLAKLVEDIFHPIILGQLAASGLHITLLGIEILFGLRDGNYSILVYSAVTVSLLLLQLYIYCYAGDYLASQAKGIRDAAYSCSWYNFRPSFAKDIMFVVVRSNRLFHLTAGKMFRMNIQGFTTLLKTIMSFFSVLKLTIVG
nr:olfactory receptor 74 [Gregopimpla kuwanae]